MGAVRVYVAGPISDHGNVKDPEAILKNVNRAILAADVLFDAGFIPFVPHLSYYWNERHPKIIEEWMAYDFHWLNQCHVLFALSGQSRGTLEEVIFAKYTGKPTYTDLRVICADLDRLEKLFFPATPSDRTQSAITGDRKTWEERICNCGEVDCVDHP